MTRYKVKVNRAGITFIAITVLLGIAAVNTGNNLLYMVVSAMLSFMLLSGVASLYNLKGVSITLIPPKDIFAESIANFRVILENKSRFPRFLLILESSSGKFVIPLLLNREEALLPMVFEKRGLYESVKIAIKTDFPVGLFSRSYEEEIKTKVVVFPKPIKTELNLIWGEKGKKDIGDKTRAKGYDEISGVREYIRDPVKLIHWKASAKLGKLMVKEMYAASKEPIVLTLDSVDGDLEMRISKLTYLTIKLLENGNPVGLTLGDENIEPDIGDHQKRKILTALALFHHSPRIRA